MWVRGPWSCVSHKRESDTCNANAWNMAAKEEDQKIKEKNPVSHVRVSIYVLVTVLKSWLNDLVCLKKTDISASSEFCAGAMTWSLCLHHQRIITTSSITAKVPDNLLLLRYQTKVQGQGNRTDLAGRSLRMYSTERKSSRSPSVRSRAEKGRDRHGWGKRCWSN